MTDQQRKARIEFVKKLLVANGFKESDAFNLSQIVFSKKVGFNYFSVNVEYNSVFLHSSLTLEMFRCEPIKSTTGEILEHTKPLKPLRDFIKLSNQK